MLLCFERSNLASNIWANFYTLITDGVLIKVINVWMEESGTCDLHILRTRWDTSKAVVLISNRESSLEVYRVSRDHKGVEIKIPRHVWTWKTIKTSGHTRAYLRK
ncbi:hypothetical protein AVEN_129527-1 [Araneus ventricosus]|uniref:Uncharacterized protein n=1 Tax=Araneus ventricosus TaxID=182803 RepID=A0A4Y2GIY1_ARAVE|nr:hypothetical protein AVEN_129527-1 [Araneus ventricosus]